MSHSNTSDRATGPNIDDALKYIHAGLPLFPLAGKKPFESGGFKTASTDENQIRAWSEQYPGSNWGMPTGLASGYDVLDVDGPVGLESLRMYEMQYGPIPETPCQETGSGGLHFLFKASGAFRNSAKGMMPGWDGRGDGGYIVVDPSTHPETKKEYRWKVSIFDQEPAEMPEPMMELYLKQTKEKRKPPEPGEKVHIGQQDNEMTRRAGILRAKGFSRDAILAALEKENQERFEPPLADADLRRIVDSVCNYDPNHPLLSYATTDAGNGEMFASACRDEIRWCPELKSWLVWDGRRWKPDGHIEVMGLAIRTLREAQRHATEINDTAIKETKLAALISAESKNRLQAMVELSRSFGLSVSAEHLDVDRLKLNMGTGTYDFRAQALLPHDPSDLITKIAGTDFDSDARCPVFLDFITKAMDGDQGLVDYLQKFVGLCLTGDVTAKVLPIFFGPPNTGKTTFTETVLALLGDYGQVMSESTLAASTKPTDPGAASPHLARLPGARLALVSETSKRYRLNQAAAKNMTGRNRMTARPMYGIPFDFDPTHKLLIETNDRPQIEGDDPAIWARVQLVPFNVAIPSEQQDKTLPEKLRAELPGIATWAIEGYFRWKAEGLNVPEAIRVATEEYRADMNPLAQFLEERCQIGAHAPGYVTSRTLYLAYKHWWLGLRRGTPLKEREFSQGLVDLVEREGHPIRKETMTTGQHKGSMGWKNLTLLAEEAGAGGDSDRQTPFERTTRGQG